MASMSGGLFQGAQNAVVIGGQFLEVFGFKQFLCKLCGVDPDSDKFL